MHIKKLAREMRKRERERNSSLKTRDRRAKSQERVCVVAKSLLLLFSFLVAHTHTHTQAIVCRGGCAYAKQFFNTVGPFVSTSSDTCPIQTNDCIPPDVRHKVVAKLKRA